MIRSVRPLSIAGLSAVLCACPPAAPRSVPDATAAARDSADEARVRKLAQVLRSADRRIIDDDLRGLVNDPDAGVRASVALSLGQIGDPAGLTLLASRIEDPEAAVRASVAFALGLVGAAESRPTLERLAEDADPSVRAAAVEALGRLHDPASLPRTAALLDDADPRVQRAAALASWKYAEPGTLLPGLLRSLRAESPAVRRGAAYALARLSSATVAPASSGSPVGRLSEDDLLRARTALAERVGDADAEVRMQVARGLASPQGAAEGAVVGKLSGDRDSRVRINAVKSLGYPGVPVKPYLDRAMTDKEFAVTRTAIESIGKICSATALGVLQDNLLKYEGSWLREALVTSLAKCDPAKLPEIVSGLLGNPDPVMRAAAAPLIAGRHEPGAIRAGLALANDPDARVAALGIAYFADQDGAIAKILGGRVGASDPVVRAAVVEAIGGRVEHPRPGTEPLAALLDLLDTQWVAAARDTIPDVKLAVLDAAAHAGRDEHAMAQLERGLHDSDFVVRRRAADRLSTLTGVDRRSEVGPASDRPLGDYEAVVRWAAVPHAAVITVEREGTLPGRFSIRLDAAASPLVAWNFAELAKKGFFDGRTVHRVVPNFVVQDGDPRGDGFGGPGYSIRDEWNPMPFLAGTLGMASDGKDTAGSQWFVTLSEQPHLDGRYTSFGHVVQGERAIVEQIQPGDTVVSIRVYDGDGTEPLPKE